MKTEKISEQFVQNLLLVMPNWHSKLIKPFKDTLNREMSLETYYCLETVKMCGAITMTKLVVERVGNEQDRRSVWIRLTPKASAYLDEYYLKNRVFIHMLEEQLTEEELQKLNKAAQVLNEILPKLK